MVAAFSCVGGAEAAVVAGVVIPTAVTTNSTAIARTAVMEEGRVSAPAAVAAGVAFPTMVRKSHVRHAGYTSIGLLCREQDHERDPTRRSRSCSKSR